MTKLDDFLNTFNDKGTRKGHRAGLNKFFKIIDKDPETYIKDVQTYEEDIKKFVNEISKMSSCTVSNYICSVRYFLDHYDVILKNKFWRELKRGGKLRSPKAETQDHIPTFDEIKRILTHANVMERAIIQMMLSSGLRIDEVLQLEENFIDFKANPVTVYLPANITKNHTARFTFLSKEAVSILNEWFKIRTSYIKNTFNKVNFKNVTKTPLDSNNIFPMEYETIRRRFIHILDKTGLNQRDIGTKHYRVHLHTFRKYFETNLEIDGCERIIVESLQGHEGYMPMYRKPSEQQLRDAYLKHENALLVFDKKTDVSKIENNQQDIAEQLQKMQEKFNLSEVKKQNFEKEIIKLKLDSNVNSLIAVFVSSGVGLSIRHVDHNGKEVIDEFTKRNKEIRKENINLFLEQTKKFYDEETIRTFKQRLHDDYNLNI
jgi:integrase